MFTHCDAPLINTRSPNAFVNFKGFTLSHTLSTVGYGNETTAIIIDNQRLFLVLNGDHKNALESLANSEGLYGCVNYFISNISQANKLSEHVAIVDKRKDAININAIAHELLGEELIEKMKEAYKGLVN